MFPGLKQVNMTPLKSSDGNTLRYKDNFPERFTFFCSFTSQSQLSHFSEKLTKFLGQLLESKNVKCYALVPVEPPRTFFVL